MPALRSKLFQRNKHPLPQLLQFLQLRLPLHFPHFLLPKETKSSIPHAPKPRPQSFQSFTAYFEKIITARLNVSVARLNLQTTYLSFNNSVVRIVYASVFKSCSRIASMSKYRCNSNTPTASSLFDCVFTEFNNDW